MRLPHFHPNIIFYTMQSLLHYNEQHCLSPIYKTDLKAILKDKHSSLFRRNDNDEEKKVFVIHSSLSLLQRIVIKDKQRQRLIIGKRILKNLGWYSQGAATLSIMTFSLTTLCIKSFYVTLSISDSQRKRHSE